MGARSQDMARGGWRHAGREAKVRFCCRQSDSVGADVGQVERSLSECCSGSCLLRKEALGHLLFISLSREQSHAL